MSFFGKTCRPSIPRPLHMTRPVPVPLVISLRSPPISLRVRSPDVAVRSAVLSVTDHAAPESDTNSSVLQIHPDADPDSKSKKRIKLGSSKGNALKEVSWDIDSIPTDSQIMELADQQDNPFFSGFTALHWACELGKDSLVQIIIDRKLVHPDTFATNINFSSFTPVFSGITSLWLIAKLASESGAKEVRNHEGEQSCLNVIRILAAAGATLDSDVTVSLSGHSGMHVTILLIAADYACLFHGAAFFKRRQTFLLEVARILADNLGPSARASLFLRRCKVDGHNAVSVC